MLDRHGLDRFVLALDAHAALRPHLHSLPLHALRRVANQPGRPVIGTAAGGAEGPQTVSPQFSLKTARAGEL